MIKCVLRAVVVTLFVDMKTDVYIHIQSSVNNNSTILIYTDISTGWFL